MRGVSRGQIVLEKAMLWDRVECSIAKDTTQLRRMGFLFLLALESSRYDDSGKAATRHSSCVPRATLSEQCPIRCRSYRDLM
jgi:hypothetical protein